LFASATRELVDTLSTFMVNDWPDAYRFFEVFGNLIQSTSNAAKAEHPRLRFAAKVLLSCGQEVKGRRRFASNSSANILTETYKVDILCAYPFNLLIQEDGHACGTICSELSAVYSA
jgi:hypothetical protein